MDVDEHEGRHSIPCEEQPIRNLDNNNNNNNSNHDHYHTDTATAAAEGGTSSVTTLALMGSSLKKRRRVNVVVDVAQEESTAARPTTRPRIHQPSSYTIITPSPSMLSVVTYEAVSAFVRTSSTASDSEQETSREINDFDSASSISSSSSARGLRRKTSSSASIETLVPLVKHEEISKPTTVHADSRRQLLSPVGLPAMTTLTRPHTHNGASNPPVETVPSSTKSCRERFTIIVHDVFLLASILFLVFLVLQGIDMYSQWSTRIHFSNDECIYVTVRTSILVCWMFCTGHPTRAAMTHVE